LKVDLKNKVIVITGAAGGIGEGCAKVLLENGATVIIADITRDKGQEVEAELSKIGACKFIHLDVTDKNHG